MPTKADHTTERKQFLLQGRDALLRLLSDYATGQVVTTSAALDAMQRVAGAEFERRAGLGNTQSERPRTTLSQLSLVDDAELELDLSLEALAREIRERSEGVLGVLHGCYRQMLGEAMGETIPPGPETVCTALEALADSVEVDGDTALALIEKARTQLVDKLDRFYKDLDRQFEQLGIRPDSRAPRARPARTPYPATAHAVADGSAGNGSQPLPGTGTPHTLTPLQQLGAALARGRSATPAPTGTGFGMGTLPVLPVTPELLSRLLPPDTGEPGGFPSLLAPQAGLVVQVLEQLFDALATDAVIPPAVRERLETLRLPCQRLALHDPAVFDIPDHPALASLDALADLGRTLPAASTSHPLLDALDAALQDVREAAHADTGVFSRLVEQLVRLAETRREQADALALSKQDVARGAIKWEAARTLAARALTILIEPHTPDSVRRFLDDCWLRVLTRTAYQHGQKHPDWRAQLELAHELVQVSATGNTEALAALDRALEARLAASGLDARQCRLALDALTEPKASQAATAGTAKAVLATVRNHPEVRMLHHESGGVAYKPGAELEACFSTDHWVAIDTGTLCLHGHVRPLESTRRMLMIVDPDQTLVLLASMSSLAELLADARLTLRPAGSACTRATEAILAVLDSDGV